MSDPPAATDRPAAPDFPAAPERAARRRPWRDVEFVSLDFEATGLDLARDAIVSFGAVPIIGGGIDIGASVHQLVHPGEVAPSPASIAVHGLRPVDLADASSIEVARKTLASALAGRFLVMWWAPVEIGFLSKLFGGGRRTWARRGLDVRDLLIALEGASASGLGLSQAAERYGVPVASPHDALDDALVTAQLFLIAAAKLAPRARSFHDLRNFGSRQAGRGRAASPPR